MNKTQLSEALQRVACKTLQETAFIFASPATAPPTWDDTAVQTRIEFSGPANGWLQLQSPSAFGAQLAANLLGLEPEELTDQGAGDDALAELVNIVMGELATAWFGAEQICEVGIPEVTTMPSSSSAPSVPEADTYIVTLCTDEDVPVQLTAHLVWRS